MKRKHLVKKMLLVMFLVAGVCVMGPTAFAQEAQEAQEDHAEGAAEAAPTDGGLGTLGIGIGAGLAVGLAGLGTGLAQSGVGAGGTGAIAEKPELFGQVLILFAIPETIVLFGFVIGILLLGKI